ncbi:RNA-directed DNA polymerase, eukaryota, reverse transcriptase zinc-binding domain protein, partial [Tanacetum coccineum]
ELSEKKMLWDYLTLVIANWKGGVVMMGDFNEVHKKEERFGSNFNVQRADAFNFFISNAGLEEVPSGGYSFTWCHKSASKMSKLDRFLISENLMNTYPNISAITLDRYLSDHRPILLRESKFDYGPIPFRFFNYWFEVEGFDKFVEETWTEAPVDKSNDMINLIKKKELAELDAVIDKGEGNEDVVNKRMKVVNSLQELDKLQALEAAQKVKIKWAIEGDENSKYYHGILNKKRNQLTIRGVLVDGIWIESPSLVKTLIPKTTNANMVKDFRPISLKRSLYKIVAKILANRLVVILGDIVNKVQSAFVVDRQILDGPFILNELVQLCKSKKKQSLIFKVDFEKAYDSVRWDYLDDIMKKFGFGERWALKQGDPLSPFLFILVMESLHISFQRLVDAGMFKGIVLDPSLHISHMFYADDAVFVGQWSESNIDIIVHVLDCFYRAFGLRINMNKSKLMGIYVDGDIVDQTTLKIGCVTLKSPFFYLGSKVGGLMSRIHSWNETVDCMVARLSKWKMKTLSIGGVTTHGIYSMSFFNGVDIGDKKPIWVKWKNALTSKEKGGLAIHGEDGKIGKKIKATYPSIWLDIVHELEVIKKHGINAVNCIQKKLGNGVNTSFWEDTWRGDVTFKTLYPRLYILETIKDVTVASKLSYSSLDSSFRRAPRGGVEQSQFLSMLAKVEGVVLGNSKDRWSWSLSGSGDFSVASVRKLIDDKTLPKVSSKFRWNKAVPIKVNILAWKVKLDCLPTRINISRRDRFHMESLFLTGFEAVLSFLLSSISKADNTVKK